MNDKAIQKDMELKYCNRCNQMTNHGCLKCVLTKKDKPVKTVCPHCEKRIVIFKGGVVAGKRGGE